MECTRLVALSALASAVAAVAALVTVVAGHGTSPVGTPPGATAPPVATLDRPAPGGPVVTVWASSNRAW